MDESQDATSQRENEADAAGLRAEPASLASPLRTATPDGLLAALLGGERYMVVTGPARSGKTRLLTELIPRLAENAVRTIQIDNPNPGPLSLKRLLSGVLAMTPEPETLPEEAAASACETIMFSEGDENATVVVVDDAHTLQADALHMLDLVSIPTDSAAHRVQILLVGRPELRDTLRGWGPAGLLDRIGPEHVLAAPAAPAAPPEGCLPVSSDAVTAVPHRRHALRVWLPVLALALAGTGAVGVGRMAWRFDRTTLLPAAVPTKAPSPAPSPPLSPNAASQPKAAVTQAAPAITTFGSANPPPMSAPTAHQLPANTLTAMLARADALLRIGDVSAARLLYERAAAAGDAAAAAYAGRTYDPRFLAALGTVGFRPDAEVAVRWYSRAIALGHREAERWLEGLERAAP